MTTTTPRTPVSPWRAPHLAGLSPAAYWTGQTVMLGLVTFASLYDALFLKPAVDLVVDSGELWDLFIALTVSLVAALLMMKAGHLHRENAGRARQPWGWPIIAWLVLGAGLVFLRYNAAALAAPTIQGVSTGDDPSTYRMVAIVLLAVYLASGILNFYAGRMIFNPIARAFFSAQASDRRLGKRIIEARTALRRTTEHVEVARGDLLALPALREERDRELVAFGDQLKAEARLRIANHLADPAATGITALGSAARSDRTAADR